MKIAFFTDCFLDLTGGIVSSIAAQKQALEQRGHTVYVFSSSFPKSLAEAKRLARAHIYPVPSCRIFGRGLTPIARRPKIIERWLMHNYPELAEFDIFYVHYEAGCSIAGLRLARRLGIPSVQVMHGREDMGESLLVPRGFRTLVAVLLNWFHSWYLPHPVKVRRDDYLAPTLARARMWTLMVNHANAADLVLTPSAHFRDKLQHYGVTRPVKVLPNGVPDELFTSGLAPRALAPGEPLRLVWHSRLSGEKRPLVFLEALTLVHGNLHVDFYGAGPDLAAARRFAWRHALPVKFHGAKPFSRIYSTIQRAHLDVLISSGYDTFGMTLIEAGSAVTPVLYVDPDMDEIVPAGGGIRATDPSAAAIAAALSDLLAHPERIEAMSRVMLTHRDAFRVSRTVDLLERYFASISPLTHESPATATS